MTIPPAPLQMCVLSEPGITTPHLDDHKPHEDAAAAEVTCEGLSHTRKGGGGGVLWADLGDASRGRKIRSGIRRAVLKDDGVKDFNACEVCSILDFTKNLPFYFN